MSETAIRAEHLSFSYEKNKQVLKDISFEIEKGSFVAVLGANGSGKTTLARHFNCLLPVQEGSLMVAGFDAKEKKNSFEIRKHCGMVFQNPENQFVSASIEEDIAFGPKNFGIPKEEIPQRVRQALELVGMSHFEKGTTDALSGGQKQRIAIAGVLASDPEIIVFDEVTNMLDPKGKAIVLGIIRRLKEMGKTIVMISHVMDEAVGADKIIVLNNGEIYAEDTPENIFGNQKLLSATRLSYPSTVKIYHELKMKGIELEHCPLTNEELVELIAEKLKEAK